MKKSNVLTSALLCFAGGSMNGYSFVMRGGILAAAQTSNLLRVTVYLSEYRWYEMFIRLVPICCFLSGAYLAHYLYDRIFNENDAEWEKYLLSAQAAAFFFLGFAGKDIPDICVNSSISFLAAMLYTTFRSVEKGTPVSTVFSTGNMRSLADNLYMGFGRKDALAKKRSAIYLIMLVSFAAGVFCVHALCTWITYKACWLVSAALLFACTINRHQQE